ncbi:MAG: DedA family protein [Neomegalonema sp.]|nr:DedA family protein [Neomegalonema sp.]
MMRRLYDWVMAQAEKPHALWVLAAIAFVESSIFPIPPDVLMIPMIIAAPTRWWKIAAVCTIASVLGGLAGYGIGALAFETIGQPVLEFYGKTGKFDEFAAKFNDYGAWAVLIAGVTPFPYKVITIASGTTGMDLTIFTLSSIVARALRFFIIGALLWRFGAPIRAFIEKYFGIVTIVFFVLLIGGFVALKALS